MEKQGGMWCVLENFKMLMSEFEHSLDEKNRIIIPNKLRNGLYDSEENPTVVITQSTYGCLLIYPMKTWQEFAEKLKMLPAKQNGRDLIRFFMANAAECEPDKQGRIMIPQKLREHAGILKDVVSVGVIDKIEVWSKEAYESKRNPENIDAILEENADLMI